MLGLVRCQTTDSFIDLKYFDIDLNHGPFAHPKAKEDAIYLDILNRYTKFHTYDKTPPRNQVSRSPFPNSEHNPIYPVDHSDNSAFSGVIQGH